MRLITDKYELAANDTDNTINAKSKNTQPYINKLLI